MNIAKYLKRNLEIMSKMVPVNHAGMSDIQNVYGGNIEDGGISISEYYRGGTYVPLNQLTSVHSTGPIPLLSGGIGQTISIGMFRGTKKAFQWVFNITENRFTSFNLYNELIAVGWGADIPVEVTINVHNGVYVVSQSTNIPTIDASGNFDSASSLVINNYGNIYGRGGTGGRGGVFPYSDGEDGGDGGTACVFNITTNLFNYGVIAGGGGGGGGGPGIFGLRTRAVGNFTNDWWRHFPNAGAGGQPFGGTGEHRAEYGYPVESVIPQMYDTYSNTLRPISLSDLQNSLIPTNVYDFGNKFIENLPTGDAGLQNRGDYTGFLYGPISYRICPGSGGCVGSNGDPGQSNPRFSYSTMSQGQDTLIYVFCTKPGKGGHAGHAIVGGSFVSYSKVGKILGKIDTFKPFGHFLKSVSQLYTNLPIFPTQSGQSAVAGLGLSIQTTINPGRIPWNTAYPGGYAFSYDTNTNLSNSTTRADGSIEPNGTPLSLIKYVCIVEESSANSVYLEGTIDDRILTIVVNGVQQSLPQPNGSLNKLNSLASGTFNLPSGFSTIEVWVRDDNNNSGTTAGNAHKIYLTVKSAPYGRVLISPEQWYVKEITNL